VIEPGQSAPDFALRDQHGETVRLSDLKGKTVVVFFYPKADTKRKIRNNRTSGSGSQSG
jgi:peroxiredoxin Q/BCP